MDLPLNVAVHCSDGRCGRSTHIILNPATDQATHLVVRERRPSTRERLVPVKWIENSTPELILLNRTLEEFGHLDLFVQTDFVYKDVPHYATDPKVTLLWPYVVPAKRVVDDTFRRVPPGELAIHRGARVRATDGRVGRVDAFLIDEQDGKISHLVLREGHLWGQREITIPLAYIERTEENLVHLNVDKATLTKLPTIQVRWPW
jgi:sporulation protein YlmC with PRC-barrel domain